MLQTVGVDSVISVDLQRPGQGHEACFFDSEVPIENISSNDILANYFTEEVRLEGPVVVVAPNSDHVKKAIKFKQKLAAKGCYERIDHAIFLPSKEGNNTVLQASGAEFLGDVKGADVIIVDDICETGGTLSVLCRRLIKEGAKRVYFCASHGLFTSTSMEMIELSPVEQVVVTDSIPLSATDDVSPKVVQISLAKLLSKVIRSGAIAHKLDDAILKKENQEVQEEPIPVSDDDNEELQVED